MHLSGEPVTVLTIEIMTIQEGVSNLCGKYVQGVATMVIGVCILHCISIFICAVYVFIVYHGFVHDCVLCCRLILIGVQKWRAKAGDVVHATISAIRIYPIETNCASHRRRNFFYDKVSFAFSCTQNTFRVNNISLPVNNGEMIA